MVDEVTLAAFRQMVLDYYTAHGRHDLPWRLPDANGRFDPYKILVSELMLQQTQVPRVLPKYQEFIACFPSPESLATARSGEVLKIWSGLGYNRRAKFLWLAARQIEGDFNGQLPQTLSELRQLPGVGPDTAGAIMAYAFNQPIVFIETNIRTVFIHHFLADRTDIPDIDIVPLVQQSLLLADGRSGGPRMWYWALMDYGTHLKQTTGNPNRASRHYAKQSKFVGSRRQLRGQVLRLLAERPRPRDKISELLPDPRLSEVLDSLLAESLVREEGPYLSL